MPETGMPTSPGLYGVTSDDGRFAVVEVGISDEVIGYTDDDAPHHGPGAHVGAPDGQDGGRSAVRRHRAQRNARAA